VAGCTQTHEIALGVASSLGKRLNMVYFLRWRDPSETSAFLAERMRGNVSVTNALPVTSVTFFYSRVPLVLFILSVGQLLMFFAKPAIY
jgi:hypothetical protein